MQRRSDIGQVGPFDRHHHPVVDRRDDPAIDQTPGEADEGVGCHDQDNDISDLSPASTHRRKCSVTRRIKEG